MWRKPRSVALVVLAVAAASTALAPVGNAQSADTVIDDLKDQGYNVVINWTTGYDTKPLDQCWVTNVNNPGDQPPGPDMFTTVYVDVACSNHDDQGGFTGGIGIGVG